MPFTATLSRRFYEKLGDDVATELITLLNSVDQSYRQEFRELFAANFGQLRAEMDGLKAEIRGEMLALKVELRTEMRQMETRIDAKLAALKAELLKWMFIFWAGMMGTVVAIVKL